MPHISKELQKSYIGIPALRASRCRRPAAPIIQVRADGKSRTPPRPSTSDDNQAASSTDVQADDESHNKPPPKPKEYFPCRDYRYSGSEEDGRSRSREVRESKKEATTSSTWQPQVPPPMKPRRPSYPEASKSIRQTAEEREIYRLRGAKCMRKGCIVAERPAIAVDNDRCIREDTHGWL